MQHLGLSRADMRAYHAALATHHTRSVRVEVCDLSGDTLHEISHKLIDGQVVVDSGAEVTRVLTGQFLDRHHTLNFDSDSPDDGALFMDRMLRVIVSVRVDALGRHVDCPVFTGPVMHFERHGDVVSIEAHGKERLALGELWRPLSIKAHTKKTTAIKTILDRTGETRYNLPTLAVGLPKRLSMDRYSIPWRKSKHVAKSMDRQLFYTPSGVCTLRRHPSTTMYTFREGQDGTVTGELAVTYSMDDLKNTVVVIGGKPKGAKHRVRSTPHMPPVHHPLSPQRLGRNGAERYLVLKVENDHVRTVAEANRKAARILEDRLRAATHATYDAVPIWNLDEGDLVSVVSRDGTHISHRLRQFTLPLGVDGDPVMTVGYLKKTSVDRKAIRR